MAVSTFTDKAAAREHVWDTLQDERESAFPFPPHGRIPNFRGAPEAARRLLSHALTGHVRCVKCNPDAPPQRPVREGLLRAGVKILLPAPRLREGFRRPDPERIPSGHLRQAATLSGTARWGKAIYVARLPDLDLIVTGSVAVTRGGRRCGKGHGYGDLEYALLRESGHPVVPVATTVHPLQILESFPAGAHDLPAQIIATPEEVIEVDDPPPAPEGIDGDALSSGDLEAIPVLEEFRWLTRRQDKG